MTSEQQHSALSGDMEMVEKLKPYSWKYLTPEWRRLEQEAIDAGEEYEAMVDLMRCAYMHGADRKLISEAYSRLDDDSKADFDYFVREVADAS